MKMKKKKKMMNKPQILFDLIKAMGNAEVQPRTATDEGQADCSGEGLRFPRSRTYDLLRELYKPN